MYAGPWWDSMEAVAQARVLANAELAATDDDGSDPRLDATEAEGDDVQDQFLHELSPGDALSVGDLGHLAMQMAREEEHSQRSAESYVSDEDDDFADLAHELGFEAAESVTSEGAGVEELVDGAWSFSPADLDALAGLGVVETDLETELYRVPS